MDFLRYRIIASLYFVSFISLILCAPGTSTENANITNSATSSLVSMSSTVTTQSTTSAALSAGKMTPNSSNPPKGPPDDVTATVATASTSPLLQICSTCNQLITKTIASSVHRPMDDSSAGRSFIKPWTFVAISLLNLILY